MDEAVILWKKCTEELDKNSTVKELYYAALSFLAVCSEVGIYYRLGGITMSADIILNDWILPESIDICKRIQKEYNIDRVKLDKSIQQNRELIKHIRDNKKYEERLQEI